MGEEAARPRVNRLRDMDSAEVSRAYARLLETGRSAYVETARAVHAIAPNARSILDVATGPGSYLPELARLYPAASITALDLSEHMLARARETLRRADAIERVGFVHGSAYEMPLEDRRFDLVLASQMIHMLDDLPRLAAEFRRVTAPGGTLFISDFRRDCAPWFYAVGKLSTAVLRTVRVPVDGMGPVLDACWTGPEVEAVLHKAGFKEIETREGSGTLVVIAQ